MRSSLLGFALISFFLASTVLGGPEGDADIVDLFDVKIKDFVLPTTFDSTIYSGYLTVPESTKRIHYILVHSKRDYKNDPLLLWLPNKEGCSVLESFLTEVGPLTITDNSQILNNEFAWNREANVLFVDAVLYAGYSVGDPNKPSQGEDDVVKDVLEALPSFFKKFPELLDNQLYLTGRHEAGVLAPKLAEAIDIFNREQATELTKYNLKGIIIGNPFVNARYDSGLVALETMYNKGMIPPHIHKAVLEYCKYDFASMECVYSQAFTKDLALLINQENLYKPCYKPTDGKASSICIMHDYTPYQKFLRSYKIREAFHIDEDANAFWMCQAEIVKGFRHNSGGSLDSLDNLIGKKKYRFLIYSGDLDLIVPTLGTTNWIRSFVQRNSLPIDYPRRVWNFQGHQRAAQAVGTVTRYNSDFYFVTVLGAGQRAAADKPGPVWKMVSSFINQERLE